MSKTPAVKRTLADIIMDKLTEKKTEIDSQCSDATGKAAVEKPQMDQRVVDMYKTIGEILSKYRSGKLPKAFKVVPRCDGGGVGRLVGWAVGWLGGWLVGWTGLVFYIRSSGQRLVAEKG